MSEISMVPELLDEIAGDYQQCADIIENFIGQLDVAKNGLNSNYEGHASSELVPSTFSKIREHLELLQICCTSMNLYVTEVREQMEECDIYISNSLWADAATGSRSEADARNSAGSGTTSGANTGGNPRAEADANNSTGSNATVVGSDGRE